MRRLMQARWIAVAAAAAAVCTVATGPAQGPGREGAAAASWPQWGRTPGRNSVAPDQHPPLDWDIAYSREGERVEPRASRNVRWSSPATGLSHRGMNVAPPAVAGGKIFVGSNNTPGYIKEFEGQDLGVLLCLREADGAFLWQQASPRLKVGKISDWEWLSVCSTPFVEGDRLWYVNNRCEVVCLDTDGFRDGENDGVTTEPRTGATDADVIWSFDLRARLNVHPHNVSSSSVTGAGDLIFLNTGNGIGWDHSTLPGFGAPSFIALKKHSGEVAWADGSPGGNILHGSWSSPAYGVLGGRPQVIFAGGDGWLYSFDPEGDGRGGGRLLWRFDTNPKRSRWLQAAGAGGDASRNNIVGFPVIHGGLVYVATGQDPEHGPGKGRLLCIDPGRRGDVSPELVFNRRAPQTVVPPRRHIACDTAAGDFTRPNPNSALRWRYEQIDRCCASPAIAGGLLVIGDLRGSVHCLDAATGERFWKDTTRVPILASPLVAGGHVYVGNVDGEVLIYRHSPDKAAAEPVRVFELNAPVWAPPIVANHVLYLLDARSLIAIGAGGQD